MLYDEPALIALQLLVPTDCGRLLLAAVPYPNSPDVPRPHAKSFPSARIANECAAPALTRVADKLAPICIEATSVVRVNNPTCTPVIAALGLPLVFALCVVVSILVGGVNGVEIIV